MKYTTKMKELIYKTQEYLNYIEEHYSNVQKAWQILKEKCKHETFIYDDFRYFCIDDMIKDHDLSKLSAEEFVQYRKQFFPASFEKAADNKADFEKAWEHHKENNNHHWENWTGRYECKGWDGLQGPYYSDEIHFVCMICDWMAMSMKFGDTPREYYEKNKDKIQLPENFIPWLYEIFDQIEAEEN